MNFPQIINSLLDGTPISLASWLAEPVTPDQAAQLLPAVVQRLSAVPSAPAAGFELRLAELILRFWAGQDIEAGHKNLFALLADDRERAMLELTVGQLFLARKQVPAWGHLERGFALATHLLEAEDYFTVLKRHELLRHLPLGNDAAQAASLRALLDEAQVIARLKGRGTRPSSPGPTHSDTVD